METRLKFENDTVKYQGFHALLREGQELQPGDRVVIAWQADKPCAWFVDCEGGLGELRRYYREQCDRENVTFTILAQTIPSWYIASECIDETGDPSSAITGPFWSFTKAVAFLKELEAIDGHLSGEICILTSPNN